MIIQEIFEKKIDRPINGVVQAGQIDENTIQTELEEYVVTAEILESLKGFYKNYEKAYSTPTKNVGVWISGFFGSGKSHFLKILSYLLDGKKVGNKTPFEYFKDKVSDTALLDAMSRIESKSSDALLFNVGSEAGASAARGTKESIIEIILRIFNEHLGYSNTLWVADFERQLASDQKYDAFCSKIEELYNEKWQDFRTKFRLRYAKIISVLCEIGYERETADFLVKSAQKEFSISAVQLGELVAQYCKSKGSDYRLIFLIDEVGQYIGTDNNLMLDLQNAVEEIGAAAMGQAWIAVTSQEKIKDVSNMNAANTKDFSKIQGRFETRINLSSSDTDEVLKRRLLEKTETASKTLESIFEPNEQLIRNRLSFDKDRTQYRSGYRSTNEFVETYPFVPYQVDLLQAVLEKIGIHGEGSSYASRGERSLLKAFQEAAVYNGQEELGNLVTMAEFYPTIRQHLESAIVQTISRAENRAKNSEGLVEYDVDVLKVLYLIKGIDHIKATPNNISTLLLDSIQSEKNELVIKESLNRLEQTMFIEKHADGTYSFLSDEEQEINKEIRNVDVNAIKIKERLGDSFFEKMYPNAKYNYQKGMLFDYNKRFDNYAKTNMKYPLTMQVITGGLTPIESALQAIEGQMVIYLNEELIAEAEEAIRISEQIRRYVNLKRNPSTTQAQHRIYDAKMDSIGDYEVKAEELLRKACEEATIFIQMQERTFRGNFEKQVSDAFDMLIQNTYKYLEYIDEPIQMKTFKEQWRNLTEKGISNDLLGETGNVKAYNEVLRYLDELIRMHQKPSLKDFIDKYNQVPYGWSDYDTIGIVLALMQSGKVKLMIADEHFTPTNSPQFYDKLARTTERDKIRVIPEIEVDPKVRRDFIGLYKDLFGRMDIGDSYQEFANAIQTAVKNYLIQPLEEIDDRRKKTISSEFAYPEGAKISSLKIDILRLTQIREPEQLVKAFIDAEDDLYDWQDAIEQLVGFYLKAPIERFDEAVSFLNQVQNDLRYTQSQKVNLLKKNITDILTKASPYSEIPQLPSLIEKLDQAIQEEVTEQKQGLASQITQLEKKIDDLKDYYSNNEIITELINDKMQNFKVLQQEILNSSSLITIQMNLTKLRTVTETIQEEAKRKEKELLQLKPPTPPTTDPSVTVVREKGTKVISSRELKSMISHTSIETQSDLDAVLAELRTQLLKELKENTLKIEL
ncbi:BREX system P-loop protein BrxC [Niallia sp. MER 6]|uniref:BREX system P-loop protein BrxC n=1 Tax=Niallia sp. MER 6 TaxID=2939567 RepID=UPI0020400C05|nr:BREX system P-loop protein BrxC [Niallia sp. MER 6]MCM3032231.1 BREX system P-loop protein BrxC [Niallia sp. MER 6]